jgi:hypothetical protein
MDVGPRSVQTKRALLFPPKPSLGAQHQHINSLTDGYQGDICVSRYWFPIYCIEVNCFLIGCVNARTFLVA